MPSFMNRIIVLLEDNLCLKRSNVERRRILLDKINRRTISEYAGKIDTVALIREDRDR